MVVFTTLSEVCLELVYVCPELKRCAFWLFRSRQRGVEPKGARRKNNSTPETDVLTVNIQPIIDKGFAESREGSAESTPSMALVVLGPEQVDQGIAPVPFPGDDEVGE
jgi:hypothetical protein